MLKSQCATLRKQFGVLLQQLDEMAKNVNATAKDVDSVAIPAEAGSVVDDASALATTNPSECLPVASSSCIYIPFTDTALAAAKVDVKTEVLEGSSRPA